MKEYDLAIIGGGPAGLAAALSAASCSPELSILLVDDGLQLGGQLIKQTHKFFGSASQFAGIRGIDIARNLITELSQFPHIDLLSQSTVTGYYEDGVITILEGYHGKRWLKVKPRRIIVATGAAENMLPFLNNDLPGVYGAGAVQTLLNVYGVIPGQEVLMVGAGNIGLIVSYQLLQAAIQVEAIVEALPHIGGYWVHASKIRRMGVPIYTSSTLKEVRGKEQVESVTIAKLDQNFNFIPGSEKELKVDTVCLAVGLSPLSELLWQAGCQMVYIPELGGYVALRDENLKTSLDQIYIAGDVAGIEEASSALLEGQLAGLNAAASLGHAHPNYQEHKANYQQQLFQLRNNPASQKICTGLKKATLTKGGRDVPIH